MLRTAAGQGGWRAWIPLALFAVGIVGCSPDAFMPASEDRDRHFQRARDAEMLRDFEAAAAHYEQALERNPRLANAHLGFAALCEGPLGRYADAVYHYQRYLRLRPNDPRADDIRRRVTNCTERLATSVPLVVRSDAIARDLSEMRRENQLLRTQVAQAVAYSAYWSNEVRRLAAALPASSEARSGASQPAGGSSGGSSGTGSSRAESRGGRVETPPGSARTHRIQLGDTLMRLSRQYGVPLESLRRANPGVNERRLLPNTLLRIPER